MLDTQLSFSVDELTEGQTVDHMQSMSCWRVACDGQCAWQVVSKTHTASTCYIA